MRRIALWSMSTVTTLVLLFSYHTSTSSASAPTVQAAGVNGASGGSPAGASATPSTSTPTTVAPKGSTTSSSATPSTAVGAKTYDGDAVMTRFGNVQVEITVAGGKMTGAQVIQVPWNDPRDQQINAYAVPILNQQALAAQSAGIDMVSGATVTSTAYIQSLQSALDQANL